MAYLFQTRTDGLGHARNAAALATGRAAFETAPELDDDAPSEADCHDRAEAELLTTAEPLADWIAKKCDCDQGRAPIDTARFEDIDLIDCDRVPVLLACIVAGDYAQMKAAACRLRTLYLKAERKAVEARTEQLMTGGAL